MTYVDFRKIFFELCKDLMKVFHNISPFINELSNKMGEGILHPQFIISKTDSNKFKGIARRSISSST